MYTSFRIQNFRGFKDLELKDLARVNLIAGKNNVGKTSLLEALLTYAGEYRFILDRTKLSMRTVRPTTELISEIDELKVLFNQFDVNSKILFSGYQVNNSNINLNRQQLEITFTSLDNVRDSSLRPIGSGNNERSTKDIIGLLFKADEREIDFVLRGQAIYKKHSQAIIVKSYINIPSAINRYRFSNLKRERRTNFLVDTLKVIEPALKDLELLESGIYGDIGTLPELIPLNSMGQGFGRIMTMLLAISASENGIVAIDEIENGLHYSVQMDVWRAIAEAAKQFNVQIFATTHSFEMIQAAYEAFKETPEDDFRFHRLFRSQKSGDIDVVTYDQSNIEGALEMKLEVR